MKDDFYVHNLFWKGLKDYEQLDPQLSRLQQLSFVHDSPLIHDIPLLTPGIYIITGGRQVGKTTTLKLIIRQLLWEQRISPQQLYYLPCDTISDFSQLLFEIEEFRQSLDPGPFVLFVDEITYVKDWERAIKSLADAGFFTRGSIVITGSDTYLLKQAMMAFPGRRGEANQHDFHLHPLSFHAYVTLTDPALSELLKPFHSAFQDDFGMPQVVAPPHGAVRALQTAFNDYLVTGGYLLAINHYSREKTIASAVYRTYLQWIIGDMLKRGKNEAFLKEIVRALYPRLSKQITWHALTQELSIDHHQTVMDYIQLLSRMDVVLVLSAFREDKFQAAPKKAKKICLRDPFIFHTLYGWTYPHTSMAGKAMHVLDENSELKSALIEGVIASLLSRQRETFYIKAEGEVDVVVVSGDTFLPIEIKNSLVLNKKDLKQIFKYKQGVVAYAGSEIGRFDHLHVVPIPLLSYVATKD